jgi:hypothetical protein
MQRDAVTVIPSCSGGGNIVLALGLSYGRFKRTLFGMAEQLDTSLVERQRCAVEFCVWLGKSGSESLQLIHQAYGDDAVRRAAVFKWCKRFRRNFEISK